MIRYSTHVYIPDTQIKPGVPMDHLDWAGQFIAEEFGDRPNLSVIHAGDHADMPSLSMYDKAGSKQMEGRRYAEDIKAANEGFARLHDPFAHVKCKRILTLGNHCHRIQRAIDSDPVKFEGVISLDDLDYKRLGWHVVPFLEPYFEDGVGYAHYWVTPMTGRPLGGSAQLQLGKLGHSAVSGHQQTLDYAVKYTRNDKGEMRSIHRVVAGAFYLHNEDYMGPQGNTAHWRGLCVFNEVRDGSFDPMFVSMDYLCRRYTGRTLQAWKKRKGLA